MILRPAVVADAEFLRAMLHEAIFTPPGTPRPAREVVDHPPLSLYISGWGVRAGDVGLIAMDPEPVGAAWFRLYPEEAPGYGFVDDATPELSIAVAAGYRNMGIGSKLLTALIELARSSYPGLSLSVDPENPARRLYTRYGFQAHGGSERTMVLRMNADCLHAPDLA